MTTRWIPTALAALLLTFGLAACGGSDGGSGDATAAAKTGATPAAEAVGTVEIGDATTADAEDGGAGEEAPPNTDELDGIPQEGVGSGQTQCAGVPDSLDGVSTETVRNATLCLLNAERTSRGLQALKLNAKLGAAATGKAGDLVQRRYFAHDSPEGQKFTVRIKQAGYMKAGKRWSVGENLGWGGGGKALPAAMVDAWVNSPPHRANLLSRKWTEIGIGVAQGTPTGGDGLTYVTEFGKLG